MDDNYNNDYIEPATRIGYRDDDIWRFVDSYMAFIHPEMDAAYNVKLNYVMDVALLTLYYGYSRYGKDIVEWLEDFMLHFIVPRALSSVNLHLDNEHNGILIGNILYRYRVVYVLPYSVDKMTFRDEEELREKMIAEMKRQRLWKQTPYTPNPRPEIGGRRRVRSRKTRTRRTRKNKRNH